MSLMTALESRSARDRVKAHVYDRLLGRGEPPRGWTREAMLEDYVEALAGYPEHVLAEASKRVRSTNTRPTWPMAGAFKAACDDVGDSPLHRASVGDDEAATARRSTEAYDYVSRRMAANERELWKRCNALGPWGMREVRRFLWERACADLRDGREPHVPHADVSEFVRSIEAEAARRLQGMAAVMGKGGRTSIGAIVLQAARNNLPPNPATERAVHLAKADAGPPVDLDEEIPPPASEADYGASP